MTADTQPESRSSSRRALLAGAVGGLGAWVASAIGRPGVTRGANGETITVGGSFTATGETSITNTTTSNNVLSGASTSGVGIRGYSGSWHGVYGYSITEHGVQGASDSGIGVAAFSQALDEPAGLGQSTGHSTGVQGYSGTGSAPATKAKTGVYGYAAQDNTSRGVWGESTAGQGIRGESSSGIGALGFSSTGTGMYGLSTSGIAVYGYSSAIDRAATVGQSGGDATGVQGVSGSLDLPTPKAKTGVYGYANQDSSAKGVFGESSAGFAGYFAGKVYVSKFQEMSEISAPAAPAANKARLFVRDNGSGKTQLCVRFPTGAVQVIKTEP